MASKKHLTAINTIIDKATELRNKAKDSDYALLSDLVHEAIAAKARIESGSVKFKPRIRKRKN